MRLATALGAFLCISAMAEEKPPVEFSGAVQTGFASTFQLTLGGTFGAGPAWQNRATVNAHNLFTKGDTASVQGWMTLDTPTTTYDWLAAVWYRPKDIQLTKQTLALQVGFQRWMFPTVPPGRQDWLVAGKADWVGRWKVTPWATAEFWDNFASNSQSGQLLYVQGGLQHRLLKHDQFTLNLKHGPAYTYSWGFYNKYGSRVFRYQGFLIANWKEYSLEGGLRQQDGLQPGIPNNLYWSVLLTRRFGR
jgi:hypothetical protein